MPRLRSGDLNDSEGSTVTSVPADDAAPDDRTRPAPVPRRRWASLASSTPMVGLASFVAVLAGLLLRNQQVFTQRFYEFGDAAANSLLVNDAQSLSLLVGHYSRVGFNHPGPAVLYGQAAGESLFTDLLGITPGPYNGQVLAVLILQAAVIACCVAVVHRWSGRWSVAAGALAGTTLWYSEHPFAMTSTWMPDVVVAPFLLLILSATSVAAGHLRHLWLLATSAGLLVHSHVEFALFAPVLTVAALIALFATERTGIRALWRRRPRSWATALAVAALFLSPIVANTLLNWPGEVPKYFGYSGEQQQAAPTLLQALHYARQYWTPDSPVAKYLPALLVVAAGLAAWTAPRHLRRPLLLLTGAAVLAEALFVVYALVGIDDLSQVYIGLFSASVPLALLLVLVVALAQRITVAHRAAGAVFGLVAAGLFGLSLSGAGVGLRPDSIATFPVTIAAVEDAAAGRLVVLDIGDGIGPFIDGTALLVHFEREGVPVCAVNPALAVQLTVARLCTPVQVATGRVFRLSERDAVPDSGPPGQLSEITVVGG